MPDLNPLDFRAPPPTVDPAAHLRLLSALMDRIACGVLACTSDGGVLHANSAARLELGRGGPLWLDGDRVVAVPAVRDVWMTALGETALRQRAQLLWLQDAGERQVVTLLPVHADGMHRMAVLAMLGQRSVCSGLGLEMLAGNHGLSAAEQRVLGALVDHRSARDIAAAHGVAIATVRKQIRGVREKLGARSIDALLLQAASLPPVTVR